MTKLETDSTKATAQDTAADADDNDDSNLVVVKVDDVVDIVDVDQVIAAADEEEQVVVVPPTIKSSSNNNARLHWEEICLTVQKSDDTVATILDNVWGESPQGQVSAIMGPSGAG